MSQPSDLSRQSGYYAARAAEERRLAMESKDPKVRSIHLELAEKYDQLAEAGGPVPSDIPAEGQRAS